MGPSSATSRRRGILSSVFYRWKLRLKGDNPGSRRTSVFSRALDGDGSGRKLRTYPRTVTQIQAGGWSGLCPSSYLSLLVLQGPEPACVVGRLSSIPPVSPFPSQQMNISGAFSGVGFLAASTLGGNNVYCIHLTYNKHMPMRIICWYLQTHCSMQSLLLMATHAHAQQASAGGRHREPGT